MAKLADILFIERERNEKERWNEIHLFTTGGFYSAYEWSAWLTSVISYNDEVRKQSKNLSVGCNFSVGYTLAKVQSVELKGVDAMEKAAALMQNLRANAPESLAGFPVDQVLDYQAGTVRSIPGGVEPLGLPTSNVVELRFGSAGRVIVRPSGTEPKVKFYFTAVAPTRAQAEALLVELAEEMKRFVPAD